jgi:hypothetical protein
MIEPEFHRPQAALIGEALPPYHVLAVGAPGAGVDGELGVGGDRTRLGAVGGDGPEVVAASPVAGEENPVAVGGKAWLNVVGQT